MKQFTYVFALLASFFVVCFFSQNAQATVTEEQVLSLKSSFQEMLDYQKEVNDVFGNVVVVYDGELKAVAEGDYVALTLPHITIKSKDSTDENVVDLGVISMNAAPDTKPGLWKIMLTVPQVISVSDNTNSDLKILMGSQSIGGVFNQALGYFVKLDMNLMNISATENGVDLGFKISKVNTLVNLDEEADTRLSGPISVSVEGFNLKDDDSSFHLGKVGFNANILKMKPLKLSEYKAIVMKHKTTFESLKSVGTDNAESSDIKSQAVMDMIFDLYNFTMDGFDMRIQAQDVNVDTYAKEVPEEGETATQPVEEQNEKFTIGNAYVGFGLKGMETDAGSVAIDFGYSGISLLPVDPQYDGVMPTDTKISVLAEKMPVKSLYALLKNTANSAAANPDMASIAGIGLMIKLPAMLRPNGELVPHSHLLPWIPRNLLELGSLRSFLFSRRLTDSLLKPIS